MRFIEHLSGMHLPCKSAAVQSVLCMLESPFRRRGNRFREVYLAGERVASPFLQVLCFLHLSPNAASGGVVVVSRLSLSFAVLEA